MEQLASEIAGQAKTAGDLNGLMRLMIKSALERMLNMEMDVHLGRKSPTVDAEEYLSIILPEAGTDRQRGRECD